jgi:hypothetical protein
MRDSLNPTEGRTDQDIPAVDRTGPPSGNPEGPIGVEQPTRDIGDQPDSRERERRDELADRVGVGMPSPAGRDQPDLLPDVEVPDEQA